MNQLADEQEMRILKTTWSSVTMRCSKTDGHLLRWRENWQLCASVNFNGRCLCLAPSLCHYFSALETLTTRGGSYMFRTHTCGWRPTVACFCVNLKWKMACATAHVMRRSRGSVVPSLMLWPATHIPSFSTPTLCAGESSRGLMSSSRLSPATKNMCRRARSERNSASHSTLPLSRVVGDGRRIGPLEVIRVFAHLLRKGHQSSWLYNVWLPYDGVFQPSPCWGGG